MDEKNVRFAVGEKPAWLAVSCQSKEEGGIVTFQIRAKSDVPRVFEPVTCTVTVPACGVYGIWTPKIHLIKALNLDWFESLYKTNGFTGAPVQCLIGAGDRNCAALGISDLLNTVEFRTVPVEETAEYAFTIGLFSEECGLKEEYDITLRLDLRSIPYYDALKDMAAWWERDEGYTTGPVPPAAKEPMYSTWYSYHQKVDEKSLLKQCRLSGELGCKSILLDDGWQTDDGSRGYAYCGDWKPAFTKIPDMASFVRNVHKLGMKVIPWYSLPFIGEESENYARFQDMLIDPAAERKWHVLDPRYPKVREFISSVFERALLEWDVDGFKMDFVDEFVVTPFSGNETDERRDFASFHEAADCMMKECIRRLKQIKPDILLEFRQTYNGPLMQSYGNIFRAVDCPFDAVENRVRVTDIRLLCRENAVHSDMLMWHPKDSAESAARQFINVLFSVPQISMRLEELSGEHKSMLRFYCSLWSGYREALINGAFEPVYSAGRYQVIKGCRDGQFACSFHEAVVVSVERLYEDMLFVNGSSGSRLYLENYGEPKEYNMKCYDCCGTLLKHKKVWIEQGLQSFAVPVSGVLQFLSGDRRQEAKETEPLPVPDVRFARSVFK